MEASRCPHLVVARPLAVVRLLECMSSSAPIVIMGVSGSGKTTVGVLLATRLGWRFVDGDDLHSPQNVAKMAAGTALNDADRASWLGKVSAVLSEGEVVVACSALRRRYRDRLRHAAPALRLVYLQGSRALLGARIQARRHRYMPPELLESQLSTLEQPQADEQAIIMSIEQMPSAIVDRVVALIDPGTASLYQA